MNKNENENKKKRVRKKRKYCYCHLNDQDDDKMRSFCNKNEITVSDAVYSAVKYMLAFPNEVPVRRWIADARRQREAIAKKEAKEELLHRGRGRPRLSPAVRKLRETLKAKKGRGRGRPRMRKYQFPAFFTALAQSNVGRKVMEMQQEEA